MKQAIEKQMDIVAISKGRSLQTGEINEAQEAPMYEFDIAVQQPAHYRP